MRAGRPLRPSLSGRHLGLASLLVLLAPAIVVTLLLTEFDLRQAEPGVVAGTSDRMPQSMRAPKQTVKANDFMPETAMEFSGWGAVPVGDVVTADDDEAEQTYLVVPGDTLASIARRFGSDILAFAAYNELADVNLLDVGQELRIPPLGYEAPLAEAAADGKKAPQEKADLLAQLCA